MTEFVVVVTVTFAVGVWFGLCFDSALARAARRDAEGLFAASDALKRWEPRRTRHDDADDE